MPVEQPLPPPFSDRLIALRVWQANVCFVPKADVEISYLHFCIDNAY